MIMKTKVIMKVQTKEMFINLIEKFSYIFIFMLLYQTITILMINRQFLFIFGVDYLVTFGYF